MRCPASGSGYKIEWNRWGDKKERERKRERKREGERRGDKCVTDAKDGHSRCKNAVPAVRRPSLSQCSRAPSSNLTHLFVFHRPQNGHHGGWLHFEFQKLTQLWGAMASGVSQRMAEVNAKRGSAHV